MKEAKMIFKKMDGINYYSNKTNDNGTYRFWESKSHPLYKHWQRVKIKKVKHENNN